MTYFCPECEHKSNDYYLLAEHIYRLHPRVERGRLYWDQIISFHKEGAP